MKRLGKGTGTIRRQRMDAITADWNECTHQCPSCREIWVHKLHPSVACYLKIFSEGLCCLEWPLMYDGKKITLK